MKLISYHVYMQDNLACNNNYLIPFPSFSMLPSLLKSIYTDIRVVPRFYHKGTRMSVSFWNETPINSFRNDSFRMNVTLVSCGNRYELVLEQNSFQYHVESP